MCYFHHGFNFIAFFKTVFKVSFADNGRFASSYAVKYRVRLHSLLQPPAFRLVSLSGALRCGLPPLAGLVCGRSLRSLPQGGSVGKQALLVYYPPAPFIVYVGQHAGGCNVYC